MQTYAAGRAFYGDGELQSLVSSVQLGGLHDLHLVKYDSLYYQ